MQFGDFVFLINVEKIRIAIYRKAIQFTKLLYEKYFFNINFPVIVFHLIALKSLMFTNGFNALIKSTTLIFRIDIYVHCRTQEVYVDIYRITQKKNLFLHSTYPQQKSC